MRHMADIGMTFDDAETCHFMAKVSGHNVRLSGYAFSEDGDQLDLLSVFITVATSSVTSRMLRQKRLPATAFNFAEVR